MRILFLFLVLASFAAAQPMTHGVKPTGFEGVQEPTDKAAALTMPLDVRYPDDAMRARRHGVTIVAAWIDAKGYVTYAEVRKSSGHVDLDAEALRAVVEADFKPAWRADKPCASRVSVPVEFRLGREAEDYDAAKTEEQLRQEADELRKAKQMLEEEKRLVMEELENAREEARRIQEKQQQAAEEREK
ncbi:MAG: TonB family protein [Bacteroidota bacterium]|jgi:TonB family protein|nr:TonB family protein [Bacteroidota bacterium]